MKSNDPIVTERRAKREAPGPHFNRVAAIWSAILDRPVSAEQVVLCMVGLKLAREAGQHEPDNMADAIGYASLIAEVREYDDCGPRPGGVSIDEAFSPSFCPKRD